MGGHAYWYFTDYEADLDSALQKLREREFKAGRYNPAMRFIDFPIDPAVSSPGQKHQSIEDAREAAEADGTRSILDIECVAESADVCVAAPLADRELEVLFGTSKPTRQMIESNMDFFDDIERGMAIYIIAYRDEEPSELFFAGYSFD